MRNDGSLFDISLRADVSGVNDIDNPVWKPLLRGYLFFSHGFLASEADLVFADTRDVASGDTDVLDLAGGLVDPFGDPMPFAQIAGVIFLADRKNTTILTVGGSGSNSWSTPWRASGDGMKLFPGGAIVNATTHEDGIGAVVENVGDLLRVTNAAGAAARYTVLIVGRTDYYQNAGASTGSVSLSGKTITATVSLIAGGVNSNSVSRPGVTLTATVTLIDGDATAGAGDSNVLADASGNYLIDENLNKVTPNG